MRMGQAGKDDLWMWGLHDIPYFESAQWKRLNLFNGENCNICNGLGVFNDEKQFKYLS
jgi:hypothetical protein